MSEKIDFVITWVDGNDPEWLAEKEQYSPSKSNNSASSNRFRDWDLMRYWFRGVEKYAPWVNQVYFVTWGHYPEWLNLEHPKLKLVKHSDFIPDQYRPTFNTNTIELNVHRIESLEEQFVMFNDDIFLLRETKPEDFFRNGEPCGAVLMDSIVSTDVKDVFPHMMLNNAALINYYFDKKEVLKRCRKQFFSLKYSPKELIRNLLMIPNVYFSGFRGRHVTQTHYKSTFSKIWEKEPKLLDSVCNNRFRTVQDITSWLMSTWNACEGHLIPTSHKWGAHYELGVDDEAIYRAIREQTCTCVCLNDSSSGIDFEVTRQKLQQAFEAVLPEKCSYELF